MQEQVPKTIKKNSKHHKTLELIVKTFVLGDLQGRAREQQRYPKNFNNDSNIDQQMHQQTMNKSIKFLFRSKHQAKSAHGAPNGRKLVRIALRGVRLTAKESPDCRTLRRTTVSGDR